MKRFFVVLLGCIMLAAPVAKAQVAPAAYQGVLVGVVGVKAYPGSAWADIGNGSPTEHGNILSSLYAEQTVTMYKRGAISASPYVSTGVDFDTKGYNWNNQIAVQGGLRLNCAFQDGGVVSIGAAYGMEDRWIPNATPTGGPGYIVVPSNIPNDGLVFSGSRRTFVASSQWWFGWGSGGRFPGSHWGTVGTLSPVEKNNLIGMGHAEQAVIVKKFSKGAYLSPYGELTLSGDVDGYDWENKALYGSGVKLSVPVRETVIELLVGYEREQRFLSGTTTGQLVVHTRFWIGWNPTRKGAL